jgi:YD repeat-containing protein
LVSVDTTTGDTLAFTYNALGLMATMTDQAGRLWQYTYDD